jgi:cysteinyl-tRNA synthetase
MTLRLYNTLTRTKDAFVPIDPENVRMYVCGPTVYDFAHVGNARPLIVFDVIFRLLRHLYGEKHVTYVRNITDVDDKINARAAEEYPDLPLNQAIRKVTSKTEKQFHDDVAALGCLPPTFEPRATEFISRDGQPEDMIRLIGKLIANGNAYVAEGNVLFDVPSMPDYGRLSNRTLDEMVAGARVEVAPYKRDPMDFVLWKPSKPGEPAWPSPWGDGRPGWHIECSAMAGALLGDTFDIHGGGIDLIFPHHENEIAQSRCAHGTSVMANYWLHNGFLQVEGEKMSKSAGNFVTIRELFGGWKGFRWPGAVIRLGMLSTHYRQPIDFTEQSLWEAHMTLRSFATFARPTGDGAPSEEFTDAIADDLNTPRAIAELHRLARLAEGEARSASDRAAKDNDTVLVAVDRHVHARQLTTGLALLGIDILGHDARWAEKQAKARLSPERAAEVENLITARVAARKTKDFAEADRLRAEIEAVGIVLKDAKDPNTGELVTTWEVRR